MMNGFKKILINAKDNNQEIKLLFKYPGSNRFTKKSGKVISVDIDSFTINDPYDGESTFSYEFLMEINKRGKVNDQ